MTLIDRLALPKEIKEGWGMTRDRDREGVMYISDGSNTIFECEAFRNFKVVRTHEIYQNDSALNYLNELEFVDGFVFANIWLSKKIVKIDLKTDKIVSTFDFTFLLKTANEISKQLKLKSFTSDDCLNGIAFDYGRKQLLLTGKNWPVLFDVRFNDAIFKKTN